MLRTAGLERSDFYIGNVFNEKLPKNDVSNWCVPLGEARKLDITALPPIGPAGFLSTVYRSHLTRLREELEWLKPTVIVPLGGTALWALTGNTAITAARGSVSAATLLVPGTKLLPTFHPMAVMHQWKLYSVVVGDLIRANAEADRGPQIILPKRELILEPTISDIRGYLNRLNASNLISVDIETGWGQITSIGFAADAEHAIVVPFLDKRCVTRSYWSLSDEIEAWRLVEEICNLPNPKLGQNFGGYDSYWLLKKYHIRIRNFLHDTRLLHHALYPELPKSLEFMGSSYATQGSWKGWGRETRHTKRDD